jgi:hypothetical protein
VEAAHAPEPVIQPGYAPPPYRGSRGWGTGAALLGALLCGGAGLTLQAQRNPLLDAAANPAPPEVPGLRNPDHDRMASAPLDGPPFVGPPAPARPAPDLPQMAEAIPFFPSGRGLTGITPSGSGKRGGIGYFGPVAGPLNTDLSGAQVVRGPIWTGKPLPAIGSGLLSPQGESEPGAAGPALPHAGSPGNAAGSELPDLQKLALARLANPLNAGSTRPGAPAAPAAAVSAEKPLTVSLSVSRPTSGYEPGATVAVRASASADAYFVLIGVDADGHASTLFKSPGAARSFGYLVRAQAQPGPQYVVVVASAQPPTGGDVAAALRAHGPGFVAPMMQVVNEAAQPGSAWSAAVSQAAALGGGSKGWRRFEWSVSAASFFTRQPAKVAERPTAEKPEKPDKPEKPEKAVASDKPAPKPDSTEGSVLPSKTDSPAPAPEKSAVPTAKPADPSKPAAPAETGK